jgi:recombinational DNA repair ATPase RecF
LCTENKTTILEVITFLEFRRHFKTHFIEIINEEENFFAVSMNVCHIFSVRICTQAKQRKEHNGALQHFYLIVTAHASVRLD